MMTDVEKIVCNVLLVSCNQQFIAECSTELNKRGYLVQGIAQSEQEIEQCMVEYSPSIVCVDLPSMSHVDCISAIVKSSERHVVPALFFEDHTSPEIVEQCVHVEAFRFMSFPLRYNLVSAMIDALVRMYGRPTTGQRAEIESLDTDEQTVFEMFWQNAPMPMYIVSKDETLRKANKAFYSLLNLDQDVVGNDFMEILFDADTNAYFKQQNKDVLATNSLQVFHDSVTIDGSERHFTTIKFPLHQKEERYYAVGAISVDQTAERQAQKSLEQSEYLLDEMSRLSKVGGWELDVKTMKTVWTKEVYNIYDVDATFDANAKTGISFYAPNSQPIISNAVLGALQGKPFEVELDFISATNQKKIVRSLGVPIFEDGVVSKIYGTFQDITKEKQKDRELQQQTNLLSAIFENIPVMLIIYDEEGMPMHVNREWHTVTGWTTADSDAIHAIYQHLFVNINEEQKIFVTADHRLEWKEVRIKNIVGADIDLLCSAIILPDQRKISFGVDITGKKISNELLRNSEERLQFATDSAELGIWDWNLDNNDLIWEGAMFSIYGITPEEFEPHVNTFRRFIHPDDSVFVNEHLKNTIETNKSFNVEFRIVRPHTKEERTIRAFGRLYTKGHTDPKMHFIGINQDITEQKQTMLRLKESEMLYRMLVQQSKDAIVIVDIHDVSQYISPAIVQITGYTPEEYQADPGLVQKIITEESKIQYKKFWEYYSETGKFPEETKELIWWHKNGQKVYVEHAYTNIYNDDGTVFGFQTMLRDVTLQKGMEQQMMRMQRMDSVGLLAGGIAHDMNNILTPILTGLQLLETRVQGKDLQRVLNLQDIVWRGANLVKQILAFSRGGTQERSPLEIAHLMRELATILRETFPKDIKIETTYSRGIPLILADTNQMHQVLMNLCINARDAMPDGGTLSMRAEAVTLRKKDVVSILDAQEGDYLMITVQDTGTGMSAETIEKMFEPFYTTKPQQKGTGLGLTTVYAIIKNHNGFLNVESTLGEGTIFRAYLPVLEDDANSEHFHARHSRDAGTSIQEQQGKGQTVLLVDDEEEIRTMLSDALTMRGYDVLTAEHGEKGVEIFEKHHAGVSAIIVDMQMPVMDGLKAIEEFRKIRADVVLIAITGYLDSERFRKLEQLRVHAIFSKPFDIEDLLLKLKQSHS